MLNTSKGKSSSTKKLSGKLDSSTDWIIDTRCSNHMTGDARLFSQLFDVSPTSIGLPNCKQTIATKEGMITLHKHMVLHNVLYVLDLTCNLSSVSHLLANLSYFVTFTNKLCIIQDCALMTLIGEGEQCDGVYWFWPLQQLQAYQATMGDKRELWHQKLGHPSRKVYFLLPDNNNESKDVNVIHEPCDICLIVKQTRSICSSSNSRAINVFHLIHCDIWGAYTLSVICGAHYFLIIVNDCSRVVWVYLMTRLYDLEEIMFFISRDVVFFKHQYPYSNETYLHTTDAVFENKKYYNIVPYFEDTSLARGSAMSLSVAGATNSEVVQHVTDEARTGPQGQDQSLLRVASIIPWRRLAITTGTPNSFKEVVKDLGWHNAMQDKFDTLERNGTWTLEELPSGKKGILRYFLGIEVAHGKDGLFLSQRKYVIDIISEAGLVGARPISTPMEQNYHLATINGVLFDAPKKYRQLVGPFDLKIIDELLYFIRFFSCLLENEKKPIVSRSFVEAKYKSMITTTCELKRLKSLLACFGI
uniref:Retrovirus-related Pol polyprotein from transposon TNT 1-94 n=1 Tax=Cajanus cajan TaxID=3821 RepID=A0A151T0V3_CAJCA|nr:Retrovirus-related Pol polyprotein from transposon TNT 1-94 [Cajanus cajan]